jgi:capsular polysaccharide transport system ATP-binding protein
MGIEASNLTKYYKVQGHKKMVFQDLSLLIPPGRKLALLGPNGAGKSTLLRVLTGIEKPNKGKIIQNSTISWPVGLSTGFIGSLTAKENIQFVCRLYSYSKDARREVIDYVKAFADLGKYFDLPMSTYSSGMRQRVSFALSMSFDFDYYVVDEALSAGDASFRSKCRTVFEERIATKGLILVSHQMNVIRDYCTEGLYLNNGQVQYSNDIEELIKTYQGQSTR